MRKSVLFGFVFAALTVSATTVKWDFPREGCCHEGIPFADEVWMSVGCGTDLQEYYVSPDEMHGPWWDILASGIRWLKANEATLADVHWIGGDPQTDAGKGEVYGYAAWLAHGTESKGVVLLRNPSGKSQTFRPSLADLLEMPTSRRSDRVAAVSKAYGHDVPFDNPDSVGQTVEFKLGRLA